MSRNVYEEHAANCVRLAEGIDEPILSFGLIKMAQAWLELADEKRHTERVDEAAPRSSSEHAGSRRLNRRTRSSSRRTIRRSKGPAKAAGKRRMRS